MTRGNHDTRFTAPLYTVPEAARFLAVPPSTFAHWARGYEVRFPHRKTVKKGPIVTALDGKGLWPSIPFVGLAEGLVVAAFRRSGVSLQHIRRAVDVLAKEIGVEHALASRKLYSDGASVLYDYAEQAGEEELLTHVVTQQRVFADVVREYLELITYDSRGWAVRLVSPVTSRPLIAVDPERSFGQPIFMRGAAPVESVVGRWKAGESIGDVAEDFGVPPEDVEDYLRAAVPLAA